jgi:undecaprenyl-diphosphatase
MLCATRGGDGWLWYTLGLALCIFGGEGRFQAVGASFLAASAGIGVFLVLKKATGRKRPCAIAQHAWATLLPPDQFSFPSGHTLTAFAVVTPLIGHYPGLTWHLLFCAASIAASRVVLGMHFLSDVVAGAALGYVLGNLAMAII